MNPLPSIHSFRRSGRSRITRSQRRNYELLYPVFGVAFSETPLRFAELFGRVAPTILEIGFGTGEATAAIAQANPEKNYLGVDIFKPGVAQLMRRLRELELTNVRVIHHDILAVLSAMIPEASLSGVHIFFPDPWPKKRHHKRRLIQPAFLRLLSCKMLPGSYLHVTTDWQDYARHILAAFEAAPEFENASETPAERPPWRPLTKFERRGHRLEHQIWDFHFLRR